VIATLRARQREVLAVVLLIVVILVRQMMVGEMEAEIARLVSPQGLPARIALATKVEQALRDAQDVKTRQDAIRESPLRKANLASTLEELHQMKKLPVARARLTPRISQSLDGGMQEESVEVMITGMVLVEVIEYMQDLEKLGPSIRVRGLRLQKQSDTLTMTMTVAALRL
jgi:hypothetical protein